jgi:hypothetical protein
MILNLIKATRELVDESLDGCPTALEAYLSSWYIEQSLHVILGDSVPETIACLIGADNGILSYIEPQITKLEIFFFGIVFLPCGLCGLFAIVWLNQSHCRIFFNK